MKWRSVCKKLARCIQTDSRRKNWTQQEDDEKERKPESLVRTDNEAELLLRLTLDYKAKARGRGVGWWSHQYAKYVDSPSKRERKGAVFKLFHSETRYHKSAFTGSIWMIDQNNATLRLHTETVPCGRPWSKRGSCRASPGSLWPVSSIEIVASPAGPQGPVREAATPQMDEWGCTLSQQRERETVTSSPRAFCTYQTPILSLSFCCFGFRGRQRRAKL